MTKKSGAVGVVVGALLVGCLVGRGALAQDLLCSAGPRNGVACPNGDEDCFVSCPSSYGACVLVQGVCNGGDVDGFLCDCPSGTCVGSGTTGTCQGGAFPGDACNPTLGEGGCGTGIACTATQNICIRGDFKSFGCLKDADCESTAGSCAATGRFCNGGDFADYSCVDNTDCTFGTTAGVCQTPDFDCTTPTPTRTGTVNQTRTPTRTTTPGTRVPTGSPTRTPSGGVSPLPTGTRTPTLITPLITASPTPTIKFSSTVAESAPIGTSLLRLTDASQLPLSGSVAKIGDTATCIAYTRRPEGNTLGINPPLAFDVDAGTVVVVGPCQVTQTYTRNSCAIGTAGAPSGLWVIAAGLVGLVIRRLRHPH